MRPPSLLSSAARVQPSVVRAQPLSTKTDPSKAVNRLRGVLEEYRQTHYRYEVPSRFKKELLAAARKPNTPGADVCFKGMQRVLSNIGAKDSISNSELQTVFKEVGNSTGVIPASQFLKML